VRDEKIRIAGHVGLNGGAAFDDSASDTLEKPSNALIFFALDRVASLG